MHTLIYRVSQKNVWKSDKSWEPGNFFKKMQICKFEILKNLNGLSWSSGHAEQLLSSCLCSKVTVIAEDCNVFFYHHITLSWDTWVHRAGSQLKMSKNQSKAGNQKCLNVHMSQMSHVSQVKWLVWNLETSWTTSQYVRRQKKPFSEEFPLCLLGWQLTFGESLLFLVAL